jgi:hypothetical protein
MAFLDTTVVVAAGVRLDLALGAVAAGGDSFANDNETFIVARNTDASPRVITIQPKVPFIKGSDTGEVATVAKVVTVPALAASIPGIMHFDVPPGIYGGNPTMTYDATTGLTLRVYRATL